MTVDPATKAAIDEMTVEDMLRRLRYATAGDPMFEGANSDYFYEQLKAKRARLQPGEFPEISRRVNQEADQK